MNIQNRNITSDQHDSTEIILQDVDNNSYWEFYNQNFFIKYSVGTIDMQKYHVHQGYEINLCIKGNCTLYVADRTFAISDHTISIINGDEFHRITSNNMSDYQRFVFFFNEKFIQNISNIPYDFLEVFKNRFYEFSNTALLDENNFKAVIYLCEKIHHYHYQSSPSKESSAYVELLLGELLILISTIYKNKDNYIEIKNKAELLKAQPIIDYIRQNISKRLSLEDLCKQFFMSKSTLIDIFNTATNMSPNKFIIYERVTVAKRLLKKGFSIVDVCLQTGFNDQSHFSRTFRTLVGKSPKQFCKDN